MWFFFACSAPPPLGPSHGGVVQALPGYTLESEIRQAGHRIWLYDAASQPVDPTTVTGMAYIDAAGAMQKAQFGAEGDGLRARAKLPPGEPAHARLSLIVGSRTLEAEVRTDNVGGIGYREDGAAHGGQVRILDGRLRVEYAPAADLHQVWLTDTQRQPLVAEEVEAQLVDGGVDVPMRYAASEARLYGRWAGAGSRTIALWLRVDGREYTVDFAP